MVRKGKEKQVTGKKRKSSFEFRDESYSKKIKIKEFRDECLMIKKPKNPGVLQFFEESANVGYYGGSSDEDFTFLFSDLEDKPELEEGTSKDGEYNEKTVGFDASAFGDTVSTTKFLLSLEKEWQPGGKIQESYVWILIIV
ncbi:Protein RNA-directed DNA methylation 3 [Cardamine amara subsp. amara]|uniref:Protein RNA-directed DNA methylation 3 n=1 Tax=Cardamine amara subsp. amara TaxID=228776 RepID=A0ABD1BUJ6_CARAN